MSDRWLLITFGIALILVLAVVAIPVCSTFHTEKGEFTVTGKAVVGNREHYLIYTDVTTYEMCDSWFDGRWSTSDLYGKIEVGKKYRCTLRGYRIPFFSMYPNIINPEEIK